ncbi:hypothetical protein [Pelagicoccus mobilis]|uniref:Aldose 1-epimerase n=1 Tax=Pelagicoccus mobilis TaxID=415221 RepID=A0A934RZG0_9BACT|nr:hypothetical protein [Pelagicoccus mobilis]MBK1877711.1 hypothetical protein [Pelagicoccus mobilis]
MTLKSLTQLTCLALSLILTGAAYAQKMTTIRNKHLTVSINQIGAEIKSIKANDTGREYIWPGDKKNWKRSAPIMFPVAVRFKDDDYTYKGKTYTMPRIGYVFKTPAKIEKTSKSEATFVYESDSKTAKFYPFKFKLTITYRLEGKSIIHDFQVENLGKETMYFDLAGHPGFTLPTKGGKSRKDYEFVFSKSMNVRRMPIETGLANPNTVPFLNNETRLNLADPRMVGKGGRVIRAGKGTVIGVAEKGKSAFIEVDLGDFPHVGIWPPEEKPLICLEPMIGHHDFTNAPAQIEKKKQLTALPAKGSESYSFTIRVK